MKQSVENTDHKSTTSPQPASGQSTASSITQIPPVLQLKACSKEPETGNHDTAHIIAAVELPPPNNGAQTNNNSSVHSEKPQTQKAPIQRKGEQDLYIPTSSESANLSKLKGFYAYYKIDNILYYYATPDNKLKVFDHSLGFIRQFAIKLPADIAYLFYGETFDNKWELWGYEKPHKDKPGLIGFTDEQWSKQEDLKKLGAALNFPSWFSDEDWKELMRIRNVRKPYLSALVVAPVAAGPSKKGKSEKGKPKSPPKPAWLRTREKEIRDLIAKERGADPSAADLPDKFSVGWSSKKTWKAWARLKDWKSSISTELREERSAEEILDVLRTKIRIHESKADLSKSLKSAKKTLSEEQLWALELRNALWKLIQAERKSNPDSAELPDRLSIAHIDEKDANSVHLVIGVILTKTSGKGYKTGEMVSGALPQPLVKGTKPEELLPLVKKVSMAIRSGPAKAKLRESEKKADLTGYKWKTAYESEIVGKNVRDDRRVVTRGKNEFEIRLKWSAKHATTLGATAAAMQTVYSRWLLYRASSQLTDEERDKERPGNWEERRPWLQRRFENNMAFPVKPWWQSDMSFFKEKEVKIPHLEGDWILYCESQVQPDHANKIAYVPSKAVYAMHAVDGYKLAEEKTLESVKRKKKLEEELNKDLPESEKKKIRGEIAAISKQEGKDFYRATSGRISDTKQALRILGKLKKNLTKSRSSGVELPKTWARDKDATLINKMWLEMLIMDPKGEARLNEKIDTTIEQLTKVDKALTVLNKSIGPYKSDFKPGGHVYTPIATLISEVTGKEYPLMLMLSEARDSTIDNVKYVLVDVTNPKEASKYEGEGSNTLEAIKAAFLDFARNNDYGDGFLAYRVPGVLERGRVKNTPGVKKTVLQVLGQIAFWGGIAALILGTVVTGGALGAAVAALGVVAAASGAVVSGYNIYQRHENYRLEPDAELALDVLGVVGGVAAVLKTGAIVVRSAADSAKAVQAAKTAGTITSVESAAVRTSGALPRWVTWSQRIDKAFLIHSGADLAGNVIFVPIKVHEDIQKIRESDLPEDKKEEMIAQVVTMALVNGFMITMSAKGFADEFHAYKATALANESAYKAMLQKHGLMNEGGTMDVPAPKPKDTAEPVTPAAPKEGVESKPPVKTPSGETAGGGIRPPKTPAKGDGGGEPVPPRKSLEERWDDPTLTLDEFLMLYEKSVAISEAQRDAKLELARSKFKDGWRYNPKVKGNGWRKPGARRRAVAKKAAAKTTATRNRHAKWFINLHKEKLLGGDPKILQSLLDTHGNWKALIAKLSSGGETDKAIALKLGEYRDKVLANLQGLYSGADTLPGASKESGSDIDLNFFGPEAGKNMLEAEKFMKETFGPDWQEKMHMNFYTDPARLHRYHDFGGAASEKAKLQADISKLAETLNFAKMLLHAGSNKASRKRIEKMMDAAGVKSADVNPWVRMKASAKESRRAALLKELDTLSQEFETASGARKSELARMITEKQMEANFLSTEAYIGPGAIKTGKQSHGEAYQNMLSQLEMIEHVLAQAGGDVVKAMREYEMYKYMYRFSDAVDAAQTDLFYDYLSKLIYRINRQGAKDFDDGQLNNLFRDFMQFAHRSIETKKTAVTSGEATPRRRAWNDPNLSADEMLSIYRDANVKSDKPLTGEQVREKFRKGLRFDVDTRRWRRPFKISESGKGREISFDDLKGRSPVKRDSRLPATRLGLDKTILAKLRKYLDGAAVQRILSKATYDQVKGQIAEEIANALGTSAAKDIGPKEGGNVHFYRGDEVAGPAPTATSGGAARAPLTDGMVAEIFIRDGEMHVRIHRIHEVKSGHGSAETMHKQVGWDIERIKELGFSLKMTQPDGSAVWHYFRPDRIEMPPIAEQGEYIHGYTPSDVLPKTHVTSTEKFAGKDLPGISAEDLHLAALMVLRAKGTKKPEQMELPFDTDPNKPLQRKKAHDDPPPFVLPPISGEKEDSANVEEFRLR